MLNYLNGRLIHSKRPFSLAQSTHIRQMEKTWAGSASLNACSLLCRFSISLVSTTFFLCWHTVAVKHPQGSAAIANEIQPRHGQRRRVLFSNLLTSFMKPITKLKHFTFDQKATIAGNPFLLSKNPIVGLSFVLSVVLSISKSHSFCVSCNLFAFRWAVGNSPSFVPLHLPLLSLLSLLSLQLQMFSSKMRSPVYLWYQQIVATKEDEKGF